MMPSQFLNYFFIINIYLILSHTKGVSLAFARATMLVSKKNVKPNGRIESIAANLF